MRPRKPIRNQFHILWHKNPLIFLGALLLVIAFIIFPAFLARDPMNKDAAEFYFTDPPYYIGVGQSFTVELHVKTGSTPINAVGTLTVFNPKLLEVVTITTEQSFCTLYTENSFDNIKGVVKVSCGTPHPGFTGDSAIVKMTLRARAGGTMQLKLDRDNSQILADDGKATNLVHVFPIKDFKVNPL